MLEIRWEWKGKTHVALVPIDRAAILIEEFLQWRRQKKIIELKIPATAVTQKLQLGRAINLTDRSLKAIEEFAEIGVRINRSELLLASLLVSNAIKVTANNDRYLVLHLGLNFVVDANERLELSFASSAPLRVPSVWIELTFEMNQQANQAGRELALAEDSEFEHISRKVV